MDGANPFDQFDGTPTAFGAPPPAVSGPMSTPALASPAAAAAPVGPTTGNPFDQFDGQPTAFGPSMPVAPKASLPATQTMAAPPATPSGAVAPAGAPNDGQSTLGGIASQIIPGLDQAAYNLMGAPVDLVRGALNTVDTLTGNHLPQVPTGTVFSSDWWANFFNKNVGTAIPSQVPANGEAERAMRAAVEGAAMGLVPESAFGAAGELLGAGANAGRAAGEAIGAPSTVLGAARNAAAGLGAGAGSQLASDAVPDQYKPLAGLAGGLAGGLAVDVPVGLSGGAARAAGNFVAPLTKGGQESAAGAALANAAKTAPQDLISAINREPGEIVPGSLPTTFQQTGNMGIGSLERAYAAQNPELFNSARADQNSARLNAIGALQPEGTPEDLSNFVRDQMAALDQGTQISLDNAATAANHSIDQFGNPAPAAAIGDQARNALQTQFDAQKAREAGLWSAIDPTNSMIVSAAPIKEAVQSVYGGLSPELATSLAAPEMPLANVIASYGDTIPFSRLTDLRSVVSQAMRAVKSPLQPNDMAYGRLAQLRSSIEDAISASVQGKVAEEQQAVASGAMAPDDTIAANLRNKVQDWYAKRSAGQLGQTSFGGDAGNGPLAFSGSGGTGLPPGRGFSNVAGDQGLPQDAGSGPFVDQAAADRLAVASAATKARKEAFGAAPVAAMLRRPGATYPYAMPPEQVAASLWRPGPAGGATIKAIARASGASPDAVEAIRSAAANSLREKGPLTPDSLARWKTQHTDALRELEAIEPGSMSRFKDVEQATETLGDAATQRKAALDAFERSALGKILKVNTPDDVTKTVGAIFNRNDAASRMRELADSVRNDPAAFQGLRKAIIDHMMGKLVSNTEAATSGRNLIKSDQFQTFIAKNAGALRQVFSDSEINSMRAVAQDLKRANRSIASVRIPGGSNTAQDLLAAGKHSAAPSILNRLLTLASEGGATAAGSLFGPLGAVGGYVGAHVLGSMRQAGIKKIDDLVRDALLDPQLAKALLAKAPKRLNAGSERTLAQRLGQLVGLSGAVSGVATQH